MRTGNASATGGIAVAIVVAIATALPIAAPEPSAEAAPARRRPNILVIVTDDQRADGLRYMPRTRRAFRTGGTSFPSAFATTPICCPSRASILTGRYAHNHGVLTQAEADNRAAEAAEESMVQKPLRLSGYTTGIFGKFLNNWDLANDPEHLDSWAIFGHSAPHGYRGGSWNVDGAMRKIDTYSTTYLRRRAVEFIEARERHDRRPWFLYVAPAAPHAPFEPEARYRTAAVHKWAANPAVREKDRTDKPLWVQNIDHPPRKGRRVRRAQLRTLMSVDDLVGALIRTLGRLNEDRRTLAIYTSDNGFIWSEHGLGTKRWPYLQSPRVPLMMRWPGEVPPGVRDTRLAANIDIAPTIADATGISLPDADGRSLLSPGRRDRLLLEYFRNQISPPPTWAATLTRGFQYIEYYDDAGVLVGREYYDLITDPWQLTNLLGDLDPTNDPSPTELAELSLRLRDDRSCAGTQECP